LREICVGRIEANESDVAFQLCQLAFGFHAQARDLDFALKLLAFIELDARFLESFGLEIEHGWLEFAKDKARGQIAP
jgi:hypothetical protein